MNAESAWGDLKPDSRIVDGIFQFPCGHGGVPLQSPCEEPLGFNGHIVCKCCKRDICDEPQFQDRNAAYEDDEAYCIPCTMALEDLSIEEIVWLVDH